MKEIFITKGKIAIVDDDDFEYLNQWKWYCRAHDYAVRDMRVINDSRLSKTNYVLMHREVIYAPAGYEVDHVNHNTLDNRKENLRLCTHSQNAKNTKMPKNNTSGYKGVNWKKERNKWYAYITVEQTRLFLGYYNNVIEAAHAYDYAASIYFGEFACLNFPNGGHNELLKSIA